MNTSELIQRVYDHLRSRPAAEQQRHYSKDTIRLITHTILREVQLELEQGGSMLLPHIGSLSVETYPPRTLTSNLPGHANTSTIPKRRRLRFREAAHMRAHLRRRGK